jgi:FG-GAP repeat
MSLHSWLQNFRSALAPRRGQRHHGRRGPLRAATSRPNVEVLEDRLTPSFTWAGTFPVPFFPGAMATGDFNNDGHLDLAVQSYDPRISVLGSV